MTAEGAAPPSAPASAVAWLAPLRAHTFETVVLEVSDALLAYLRQDGIFAGGSVPESSISTDEDADQGDDWDDLPVKTPQDLFPELHKRLGEAISRLGGAAVPKLGPCAPKDAVWISTEHSLRCQSPEDVYELLKASDRVALSVRGGSRELVLRRWFCGWDPSMEFRCFVRARRLVGVCQRDDTVYYEHLHKERVHIMHRAQTFFHAVVRDASECDDYVLDLYLDVDRALIVDVGPWDRNETSAILFDWDELLRASAEPPLRLITSEQDCRIGHLRYSSSVSADWDLVGSAGWPDGCSEKN